MSIKFKLSKRVHKQNSVRTSCFLQVTAMSNPWTIMYFTSLTKRILLVPRYDGRNSSIESWLSPDHGKPELLQAARFWKAQTYWGFRSKQSQYPQIRAFVIHHTYMRACACVRACVCVRRRCLWRD